MHQPIIYNTNSLALYNKPCFSFAIPQYIKLHVYREIENHHYIPKSRVVSGAEKECGYEETIDKEHEGMYRLVKLWGVWFVEMHPSQVDD